MPAPFFGVEIRNLSQRPVASLTFTTYSRDGTGTLFPPGGATTTFPLPSGRPLDPGSALKEQIPRAVNAVEATCVVFQVTCVDGGTWTRTED